MAFTDTALRAIRAEVGSTPSDDDLADAWDAAAADGVPETRRWAAVAYQVLAVRWADLVGGLSASTSVTIPGALSVSSTNTSSPAALRAQLDRLRGLAGAGGTSAGLTGGRVLPTRTRTAADYPVWPPRL